MTGPDGYCGRRISLLTQHGKEQVIAPIFSDSLGAQIELATGFDTDSLGTFTRDVARQGNQLEAARKKALKGMDLLGIERGVASEGSFGPGPFGFFPSNLELVILVDRVLGLEIVGRAEGAPHSFHERLGTYDALVAFAERASFPAHGLVVRPDTDGDPRIRKGISDWSALRAAFDEAIAEASTSVVFVESDLRAHMNPTRMEVIRRATHNLVTRIQSKCPRCASPGFWAVERIAGLPCRDCESPTDETRAVRWGCVLGDHFETRDVATGRFADPYRCSLCNP